MPKQTDTTVIKKYANRRLYNTGTSTYVTLDNLATMVKNNEDFVVQDAKTGEDITHAVLTQIIFEQENKGGQTLMPITFLRQLIRFYGDQMQMVVPGYLEQSMSAFSREQENFREQMEGAMAATPMKLMEAQVRRNTEMFRQAMSVFNPFMAGALGGAEPAAATPTAPRREELAPAAVANKDDIAAMRQELAAMRERIEALDAAKASGAAAGAGKGVKKGD